MDTDWGSVEVQSYPAHSTTLSSLEHPPSGSLGRRATVQVGQTLKTKARSYLIRAWGCVLAGDWAGEPTVRCKRFVQRQQRAQEGSGVCSRVYEFSKINADA